jgi:uncharacterized protein (TIGR02246 family)
VATNLFFNGQEERTNMSRKPSVEEAVKKVFKVYGESVEAGDPDRWISNWTDDCFQLPPGGPMMVGKEMLRESITAWLSANKVADFQILDYMEIQEAEGWAYVVGQFSYNLALPDGSPSYSYMGKFLSIFQQQADGEWKLHCDCFNANRPD